MTNEPELTPAESLAEQLHPLVAGGFAPLDEIRELGLEFAQDDFEDLDPGSLVDRALELELTRQAAAEATWPDVTDCNRLDDAFAELERRGIVARQNFSCCGTCGAGEIVDEMEAAAAEGMAVRGYTFFHEQDTEHAVEGYGVCLAYGSTEDGEAANVAVGHEIVEVVKAAGLEARWDGDWDKRIVVPMDWKKRRGAPPTR